MIEKEDFYHGAAIMRLIDYGHPLSFAKHDIGYRVNETTFLYLKYTTKSRSPWRFTFSQEEINRLRTLSETHRRVIVAFICGGDGVCAITAEELFQIGGLDLRWVSVQRKHRERYAVSGPAGDLGRKVALQRWPLLVLGQGDEMMEEQAIS